MGEFAVMCIAMCMGGALLALLTFQVLAMAGFAELGRQVPELTIVILAVAITLPMIVYMQFRGHPVRHNLEMSGASLAAGLLVLAGYWLDVVPRSVVVGTGIFGLMCGVMCLAMLVDMLIRAGHYTGRHAASG